MAVGRPVTIGRLPIDTDDAMGDLIEPNAEMKKMVEQPRIGRVDWERLREAQEYFAKLPRPKRLQTHDEAVGRLSGIVTLRGLARQP